MALAGEQTAPQGLMGMIRAPMARTIMLMVGVAALVAIMAGVWMWSQKPDYRVLFSNFSDKDGGAIVASLQQMNVPYRLADGGGAILVPADQVHDVRLRLASQGLPKGGGIGFELMENQKLGVSQFLEQVNFQRALEGEMARSIQSIAAVQTARVHLAIHKPSVFVREQQKPTASVLLNLHPGRTLDQGQVNAIVHMVASSVPGLTAANVTVVDQTGTLLSSTDRQMGANGLNPAQIKYVQELQKDIVKRVESILTPIVGASNVRAEATADVDFSHSEQAAEMYKPNQAPNPPSVRSQQSTETQSMPGNAVSGIPGALSNQPPGPASAPLTQPAGANAPAANAPAAPGAAARGAAPAPALVPLNTHKDTTINYEIDKTIRYTQQPMGGIKRLSVAVVVNYKKQTGSDGKVALVPLAETEKEQITNLVREAMGYNKDRGDSLNVVNSPFASPEKAEEVVLPMWKRPEVHSMAKEIGKYILVGAVLLWLFFSYLRPLLRRLSSTLNPPPALVHDEEDEADAIVEIGKNHRGRGVRSYEENLEGAKRLAREDPKMVANVVKSWVGRNE